MERYDSFQKNNGKISLFDEVLMNDYYDGATEALCKLRDSEEWMICSMVYFNPGPDQKIFTMINISGSLVSLLKPLIAWPQPEETNNYYIAKEKIRSYYLTYQGIIFLLKLSGLDDIDYDLVQINNQNLHYFRDIHEVMEQDEMSKLKWLSFFRNEHV